MNQEFLEQFIFQIDTEEQEECNHFICFFMF